MPSKLLHLSLSFSLTLLLHFTLAHLNLLSTLPEGDIFSFSSNPHTQYLSALQVAHTVSINPSLALPIDDLLFLPDRYLSPSTSLWFGPSESEGITQESLQKQFDEYAEKDDVWNVNFLENLFIFYEPASDTPSSPSKQPTIEFHPETYAYLKTLGVSRLFLSRSVRPALSLKDPLIIPTHQITSKITIPPGPFIFSFSFPPASKERTKKRPNHLSKLETHNIYKLHLDEYDAFLFGAIPDLVNGGWLVTNITNSLSGEDSAETQLIPVPSRLPSLLHPSSKSLPLAGMRFGLKDIFDAQGLPTAAGSLAYALTHPTPNHTAPSLMPLLLAGAHIVGKTRTSQFAHGAHPWEYHDFPYSYNPRGDGHLTAAASSSGSACAVAGYKWLDGAVGSDTRGSVRRPASLVGVFGMRPSHGLFLDMGEGVVPLSEEMDTAGVFVRDPEMFWKVAMHWYGLKSPIRSTSASKTSTGTTYMDKPASDLNLKLIYPTEHFPLPHPAAQKLIDTFVSSLSTYLGIQPSYVNFTEVITSFFPNESYMQFQETAIVLAEYRSWVDVGYPTTERYREMYGEEPVFDSVPKSVFERVRKEEKDGGITREMFERAVRVKRGFQSAMEGVFKRGGGNEDGQGDRDECDGSTLFVYHTGTGGKPSYRVEEFNHLSGTTPFLFTAPPDSATPPKVSQFFHLLASLGGMPELTLPLGEVKYWSQISRRWERIPVSVQVVGGRGCDWVLVELVRRMEEMGVVREVGVGRSMF